MPLQQKIQPKASVPEENRTPGKDEAFEAIEELRESGELYDMTLEEVADEAGFSRAHIQNTIRDYYQRGEEQSTSVAPDIEIDVPQDVSEEDYLRGWVAGYLRGKRQ